MDDNRIYARVLEDADTAVIQIERHRGDSITIHLAAIRDDDDRVPILIFSEFYAEKLAMRILKCLHAR